MPTAYASHPLAAGYPPVWASAWGQDAYGPWCAFDLRDVIQRLRWIPPGRFRMGSPSRERGRFPDEGPQHEVQLTQGFWLFDTPCTQALWQAVMGTNPSGFQGEQLPVDSVSWEDCQAFLAAFNRLVPELPLTLPTEAQWEYACRAGTTTPRYEAKLNTIAWYGGNSRDTTHVVAQKRPNAWGLYDMLGNVWEWCHDGLRDYTQQAGSDPIGPTAAGADRALRGGGWSGPALDVRAALRFAFQPGLAYALFGFRAASSG
jgi:formylglycine-generating enzyme required for sulfatase activity